MKNDQVIWQSFTEGNKFSYEELMRSYFKVIFNYGTRFTRDAELVKDCIQDLFLTLWNRKETIAHPTNIKAYLFAALRRDLLRKIKSQSKTIAFDPAGEKGGLFNLEISIEQQFILNESVQKTAERIGGLIKALPSRQKEVIYLKFFHDLNRAEIAETMNINQQTVSNLLQMALKRLRGDLSTPFDQNLLFLILPVIIKETIL